MSLNAYCLFRCAFHSVFTALAALVIAGASGCSAYVTPGRGVSMASLAKTDADIGEMMKREPAAVFPAHLAVVRVQDSEYRSYRDSGYGHGVCSIVTAHDVERNEDMQRLQRMPMVAAVGTLNRMVIPTELKSIRDLRLAAASLKADMLLAYTFDTAFRVNKHDIGPLGLITLGFLPVNEAMVTTTASAALVDVRTGYVYGLADATVREKQLASAWTSRDAVDDSRVRAERKAFEQLLTEFEKNVWTPVVQQHGNKASVASAGAP